MINSQAEPLFNFIFDFDLRIERLIIFDAILGYYNGNELCRIKSEIQVIILSDEIVMFIIEFKKPEYKLTARYSTAEYSFVYANGSPLIIKDKMKTLLTIAPANFN